MMKAIHVVMVGAFALGACTDGSPTAANPGIRFAATDGGTVQEVLGGGTYVREDLEGAPRGTYAFHARRDGAGRVSGEAEIHFASSDVRVHIDIRCLAIERNLAWLSGPVTLSNDPGMPVDRVLRWQVQDNGDGNAAYPDRISGFAYLASGNHPPDVCLEKSPLSMKPWQNGEVRILTPGGIGLSDLVGTWDVTKFVCINLANPADSQSLAGSGMAMRQTIAPNGRYTTIWWRPGPPGEIVENIRGWVDVVNGVVRAFGGESSEVIEYPANIDGNISRMEFDGNVCHWDDDDQEDPSHVIGESRRKRSGILVDDVAGTWEAVSWRYTSVADPTLTVDMVAQGITITLGVGLDGHYTTEFRLGEVSLVEEADLILEGDQVLSRKSEGGEGSAYAGTFELKGDVWLLSGLADNDFDGDPQTAPEPAWLQAVLVRR